MCRWCGEGMLGRGGGYRLLSFGDWWVWMRGGRARMSFWRLRYRSPLLLESYRHRRGRSGECGHGIDVAAVVE